MYTQDAEEGLTQFQLAVDSGRGTGSSMQLTPSSSLSRSTLLMLQCVPGSLIRLRCACMLLSWDEVAFCCQAHMIQLQGLSLSCSVYVFLPRMASIRMLLPLHAERRLL